MERPEILPIGSVLYLKEGIKKVMIIGKRMMKEKNGIQYYFDYTACLFPEGLMSDEVIFVNEEDIADIIFLGYDDTDSEQINKRIIEWQNESNVKKGSMAIFVDEE